MLNSSKGAPLKYSRLDGNDDSSSSSNPMHAEIELPAGEERFSVKVLYDEKTHIIDRVSASTPISSLKKLIEKVAGIPAVRQRLICAGKQLKPDDLKLSSFNVSKGTMIHLFPLPAVMPAVAQGESTESETRREIRGPLFPSTATRHVVHTPVHFDPSVEQTGREVKLWSIILLFLSAMTLFNNLTFFASTGKLGSGVLDSIVTVLDTLCSIGGVYVGQLGARSVRTMEMADIQKYLECLGVVALMSIVLRVIWVFDVVLQIKKAVRESQEDAANKDGGGGKGGSINTDDEKVLDPKLVSSFMLQAILICLICVLAWVSCLIRAIRLRNAVESVNLRRQQQEQPPPQNPQPQPQALGQTQTRPEVAVDLP